ncbi:hypothetical protein ACQCU1_16215 [Sutcliffiella horikoshii]
MQEFVTWTFDGEYSFYDNNIQKEKINGFLESVDRDNFFSVITDDGH